MKYYTVCLDVDDETIFGPYPNQKDAAAVGASWVANQWREEEEMGQPAHYADDMTFRFDVYAEYDISGSDQMKARIYT